MRRSIVLLLVLVLIGSCSLPIDGDGCPPGEARSCTCSSGAMGTNVCIDGSHLACVCDELDAGEEHVAERVNAVETAGVKNLCDERRVDGGLA